MKYSDYWIFGLIFLASCTSHEWSNVQRQSVHNMLQNWGHAPAMDAIDTTVYNYAVDCTLTKIESMYPSFSKFSTDTLAPHRISVVLVECIAENIGDDFENLRFVMPYNQFVNMGALPSGMNIGQQKAFYSCLADQAREEYHTPRQFMSQVTRDASRNVLENFKMRRLIVDCCQELSIPCPMTGGADIISSR